MGRRSRASLARLPGRTTLGLGFARLVCTVLDILAASSTYQCAIDVRPAATLPTTRARQQTFQTMKIPVLLGSPIQRPFRSPTFGSSWNYSEWRSWPWW